MSQNNRNIRVGLWYDFRNPRQWRQPSDRLYGEILDQIAWSENNWPAPGPPNSLEVESVTERRRTDEGQPVQRGTINRRDSPMLRPTN
jgi:hypothetical protein